MTTDPKTYTMHPTIEQCWLHRGSLLYSVEISDGEKGLYCAECGGPSHPDSRTDPYAQAALDQYEHEIDRRVWRRLGVKGQLASLVRALVAHFTTPRCTYCGTRQDRPANGCRGSHSISFRHVREEQ